MTPLLLLLPIVWLVAYRRGRGSADRHVAGYGPFRPPSLPARRPKPPKPWNLLPAERRGTGRLTASHYLQHLNEAAAIARTLDLVKDEAQRADVVALMGAPDEVAHALAAACAPMDVLFAQKDLNVLGAEPAIAEDGRMGATTREALVELQNRFGQSPTGRLDAQTAAAIRYAVGCIYSQDRAFIV